MEEDADGLVGARAAVGHGEGVHGPVAQDGIAVGPHLLDDDVGVLLLAVLDEGNAHGDSADDLLMLRLAGVVAQLGDGLGDLLGIGGVGEGGLGVSGTGPDQDHADGHAGGLTSDGRIGVQQLLELVDDLEVGAAKRGKADAEGGAVADDLVGVRVAQVGAEEGGGLVALGGRRTGARAVDEAEGVQAAALGVTAGGVDGRRGAALGFRGRGEVGLEEGHGLGGMAGVDDAQGGRGGELGPVNMDVPNKCY